MRPPALPIRGSRDSAALLDRGGRPTLRELLAGLEFDAGSGALRLNAERVTLQPAEADRILRRELIAMLGEEEARIFLLRRGFRMGMHDAAFIARSWPNLDRGDAFTAGPRVHQFSGIVRVETIFNDFDFAKGRFAAEFLWHNSLEAEGAPLTAQPVCWQQLGYASGYASHFFGALVVYKETACAAQGHKACRVVGRLASGWGEEDPDVILFQTRIAPASAPARRTEAQGAAPQGSEALILGPLLPRLERAFALPLPCLIAGEGAQGQEAAVAHLLRLSGRGALRLRAGRVSPDEITSALAQSRRPRRKEGPLVIEGIEALPMAHQAELAEALAETRAPVILTATQGLGALSQALVPALWLQLAPLALELPPLPQRRAELAALAEARLAERAAALGLAPPEVDFQALTATPPQSLTELDALLTALLAGAPDLAEARARIAPQAPGRLAAMVLASEGFSLPDFEAALRAEALKQAGGNLSAAARLLGITRPQLAYREKA